MGVLDLQTARCFLATLKNIYLFKCKFGAKSPTQTADLRRNTVREQAQLQRLYG